MDHFESVVIEYLRADRSLFVNSQCCIQLNAGKNPDTSGPHWYCDALAVSIKDSAAYLCEITYATPPNSLLVRLAAWARDWPLLRSALARDSGIPDHWSVTPWLFVPDSNRGRVESFLGTLSLASMPAPRITVLEDVMPWKYRSWDRTAADEATGSP
ncbi:hypothetical protein [Lysobacter terrae]